MTLTDKENLERKLDHVISMGNMLCQQYTHITCTERAALLLAMLAAVKQVSCNVANVRELLNRYIIDSFKVSYTDYADKLTQLLNHLNELAGAPMVDTLDTSAMPVTGIGKIIGNEDLRYHVNDKADLSRLTRLRMQLLEHATPMYAEVMDGLKLIIADLRGITADYYRLNDNESLLNDTFENLKRLCEESIVGEEQDEMDELAERLNYFMTMHGNGSKQLKRFLQRYEQECGELANVYFDGFSPARELLRGRQRYTMEDVFNFFREVRCHEVLLGIMRTVTNAEKDGDYLESKSGDIVINLLGGTYVENEHNYYK